MFAKPRPLSRGCEFTCIRDVYVVVHELAGVYSAVV